MLRYEEKRNIFFAAEAKLLQEAIFMSDENMKNETKDMLEKIDEQLQKHMKSLEKAEKGLKSAQQKIRTCKKAISDIQKMRSAIIGEKVVAMGFDTPQELERLYALAQEKKEQEVMQQQAYATEENAESEAHEGAMM